MDYIPLAILFSSDILCCSAIKFGLCFVYWAKESRNSEKNSRKILITKDRRRTSTNSEDKEECMEKEARAMEEFG